MFVRLISFALGVVLLAVHVTIVAGEGCYGEYYLVLGDSASQMVLNQYESTTKICKGSSFNVWFQPAEDSGDATNVRFEQVDNNYNVVYERCERQQPFAYFGDQPKGAFFFAKATKIGTFQVNVYAGYPGEEVCKGASNCGFSYEVVDCPDPKNV